MKSVSKRPGKEKPLVFRSGGSVARIYTVKNTVDGVDYAQYTLAYYQGATRVRRKFSDLAAAKQEAELVVAKLAAGESEALKLTGVDRSVYLESCRVLRPLGVSLSEAVRQYAEALELLPDGVTIPEAARFYQSRAGQITRKRVSEVVAELIESKARRSRHGKPASDKYLTDLASRLGKLSKAFAYDLCDITPEDVRKLLDELNLKGRTHFNHARLFQTFFKFAQARGYYPRAVDPMQGVDVSFEDDSEIEIFTPEDLIRLFNAARVELVPYLAIAAFAGLRSAELARLDWEDVWRVPGHIEIKAAKAKTRSRRLVPIQPNLLHWLEPYKDNTGQVTPFVHMSKQLLRLAKETAEPAKEGKPARQALEWRHNALRHSFISYRLAQSTNENAVAAEAGNSPAMIHKHYRQLVTPEQGATWFSIVPPENAAAQGKFVPMVVENY